ncbi:hypothetical protein ACFRAO_10790 [Streptomyces sp. NPDC056656]|uniref:hypothetical protein n=1 Tax=Streptomyces sp. NPDC056656 TaxID=3345895 RepID=UPI0036840C2D
MRRLDKRLAAAQWKMADCLEANGSTPEEWQDSFVAVHDAWTEFSAAVAAVTVAGPRSVADAADVLRTAMYAIEEVGMEWMDVAKEIGHGLSPEFRSRFVATAVAKRQPDKEFQVAARAALNTEAP